MADNLKDRFSALSDRLKRGGAEVSRKMSVGLLSVSEKTKELIGVSTPADKLVEEFTDEGVEDFDWYKSLELCDSINQDKMSGQEVVRALKKRILLKNARVQLFSLCLLDTCVKNCEKMFADVSSERLLDEMVKLIDDPETPIVNRDKALKLVETWGEQTQELHYLPMFEETYKSLKSRGVKFPTRGAESLVPVFTPPMSVTAPAESNDMLPENGIRAENEEEPLSGAHSGCVDIPQAREMFHTARNCGELLETVLTSSPQQEVLQDELTTTLVQQCQQLQSAVQRVVEQVGDNESFLFEALTVNDELQKVLGKFEEMCTPEILRQAQGSSLSAKMVLEDKDRLNSGKDDGVRKHISVQEPSEDTSAMEVLDSAMRVSGEVTSNKLLGKDEGTVL